jgi:2-polyprenyl-3-methyl-5-hydroxy-6-metoxy-1,4-benzoquinol methylase
MFKFLDAYAAKFYFDRFRANENLLFDWHYNILEATIKNAYIFENVTEIISRQKIRKVLDMGCGNGHVSKNIARITGASCVGFDPNLSYKTLISVFKFKLLSFSR